MSTRRSPSKAGIKPEIIAAIRDGRRPEAMSEDEAIVYDFSTELQRNKRVSDATWARAEQRFGKPAVVDLVGISGYYTFLAMQLNAARYAPPEDRAAPAALPGVGSPRQRVIFRVRHHIDPVRDPVGVVEEPGHLRDVEDVLVGEPVLAQRGPVGLPDLVAAAPSA